MTFRYQKVSRKDKLPKSDVDIEPKEETAYEGSIDGKRAAQGEENFNRAVWKTGKVVSVEFRKPIGAPIHFTGQKELDFLIQTTAGEFRAIQVRDFDFIHSGSKMEGKDMFSDLYIMGELSKLGIRVPQIESVDDNSIATPELAKRFVEGMML